MQTTKLGVLLALCLLGGSAHRATPTETLALETTHSGTIVLLGQRIRYVFAGSRGDNVFI